MYDDSDRPLTTNVLEAALTATAIVAFVAAMVAGGTLAMPLGLLGGVCLGGIIVNLTRTRKDECWPRCDENEAPDAVPTVIDTDQPLTRQPRRWVETVATEQRSTRTR